MISPTAFEFNAQALSKTVCAYSKAGIEAPLLFKAIAEAAPSKIAEFNPQELANTAWADPTGGVEGTRVDHASAGAATMKTSKLKTLKCRPRSI